MAKIIINAITHRAACTDGLDADGVIAYDAKCDQFFDRLGTAAKSEGFEFEVDHNGSGPRSYYVADETDYADWEAAHDFMQSHRAKFWDHV